MRKLVEFRYLILFLCFLAAGFYYGYRLVMTDETGQSQAAEMRNYAETEGYGIYSNPLKFDAESFEGADDSFEQSGDENIDDVEVPMDNNSYEITNPESSNASEKTER